MADDKISQSERGGPREIPPDGGESGARGVPFGPGFFLGQLRAFARDRCPDPAERLPSVTVHLVSGEELELCHVIGLAPGFVALAVRERASVAGAMAMRTELVPYVCLARVTIRPITDRAKQVGFNAEGMPPLLERFSSPEEALRSAAAEPASARGPSQHR